MKRNGLEDIYGSKTSESFISDVIPDKLLPQIEDWQNRPLDEVYLILYIDAIHYSIRDNNVIRKLAAYIILGINTERKKKFWLSVLVIMKVQNISFLLWTNWKTGDIKDVLAIYADGLTGIKEAIATAFPKTEYQRCIVHQVRNTLKYVPDKDRKTFVTDLKIIYQTCNEKKVLAAVDCVTEKWFILQMPSNPWIPPTGIWTEASEKRIYKWYSPFKSTVSCYIWSHPKMDQYTTIRNWAQVYGELSIIYEGRLPK